MPKRSRKARKGTKVHKPTKAPRARPPSRRPLRKPVRKSVRRPGRTRARKSVRKHVRKPVRARKVVRKSVRRPVRRRARKAAPLVRPAPPPEPESALHRISLTVNGTPQIRSVDPRLLLVDFLRDDLGLTGAHVGCDTSHCGACTVLVDGRPVKSCTMFAVQADGTDVVTIEGLSVGGKMSPVQEAFLENHGLQCGYCTPGVILAATAFLRENPSPTEDEIRSAVSGNLCRCTGYQNIVRSVAAAAAKMAADGAP